MSRVCRNKKQVRNNGAVHSCCVQKVSFLEEVTKLQSFGQFEEKIQKKERKETASRSFLYSASCYEKNRYIPYFSKTTQRNDAHGSKMSDESKVDQLRRNCSAQIKQPQKGKIKSNNLHFYLTEKEGGFCIPCPSISPAARLTRILFKQ